MTISSVQPLLSHDGAVKTLERYFEYLKTIPRKGNRDFFIGMVKAMEELLLISSPECLEWAERAADLPEEAKA